MNKTAIKNFAIWARNKLIADISYKAGLLGITGKGIKDPLPQSTRDVQFFDIGTKEPYSITGVAIEQRRRLAELIQQKDKQSDYKTAYKSIIEEVAYTWFNRLIAVRFMEVNDYLPSRIRVLSSESDNKIEPDLVTNPFDAELVYTPYEKDLIMQLKYENKLDELFRMLFIKQCNALNTILPELFEKTNDYTELLMNVSFTDQDGVVYRLVHDIPEDNFDVTKEGQVEIIGWLYQYYNTEPKDETFALLKKNVKITKERIPAATQLFTPHWIVRYMVENSLGRLWIEGHPNEDLKANWKYYLDEAEQESDVQAQLDAIRDEYKSLKPEDIKVLDPCMGSGHILVYAFNVLMQIYESCGYSQRDAAKSILESNLYGLDIDNRAYQLAYFALMMKARHYNRRIFHETTNCNLFSIQESNGINRKHLGYFGNSMSEQERGNAFQQLSYILDTLTDASEYGSILKIKDLNWDLLFTFITDLSSGVSNNDQITFESLGIIDTKNLLKKLIRIAAVLAKEYDVVVTNPPYMGNGSMGEKLSTYLKNNYQSGRSDLFAIFIERCMQFTRANRFQAMITQHQWMFLSSYAKLRDQIISKVIINMAHLGPRSFEEVSGEVVQTTSFVLNHISARKFRGIYRRLVDYRSQKEKEEAFLQGEGSYISALVQFCKLPGHPIVYWISDRLTKLFDYPPVDDIIALREGIHTGKNEEFLRYWFEISYSNIVFGAKSFQDVDRFGTWVPYNKGGSYRKWYGNNEWVIGFNSYFRARMEKLKGHVRPSQSLYFKEGATWSALASGSFGLRYYPEGFLFDSKGQVAVGKNHFEVMALFNTKAYQLLANMLMPTLDFKCGDVKKLPYCHIADPSFIKLAQENVDIAKNEWDSYETSWDFISHPFIVFCNDDNLISSSYKAWSEFTQSQLKLLKNNEESMNQLLNDYLCLHDDLTPSVEDKDLTIRVADLERDVRSLLSYVVGCIFGRYSTDFRGLAFAGGYWDKKRYNTFIPDEDNIVPITDEDYFRDDIVGLLCTFIAKTFGWGNLEENLAFIARSLGHKGNPPREVIRNYFLKDFFVDHCKIYKKRPIYWLYDSGKENGFKALIYMHRYNPDTIGKLRVDYLHRMQRIYESEISRMQDTIDTNADAREVASATKRKEKLIKQLKETKEYDEKLAHLALARISIDLDDGVRVNYEKVQTGSDGKRLQVLAEI